MKHHRDWRSFKTTCPGEDHCVKKLSLALQLGAGITLPSCCRLLGRPEAGVLFCPTMHARGGGLVFNELIQQAPRASSGSSQKRGESTLNLSVL